MFKTGVAVRHLSLRALLLSAVSMETKRTLRGVRVRWRAPVPITESDTIQQETVLNTTAFSELNNNNITI